MLQPKADLAHSLLAKKPPMERSPYMPQWCGRGPVPFCHLCPPPTPPPPVLICLAVFVIFDSMMDTVKQALDLTLRLLWRQTEAGRGGGRCQGRDEETDRNRGGWERNKDAIREMGVKKYRRMVCVRLCGWSTSKLRPSVRWGIKRKQSGKVEGGKRRRGLKEAFFWHIVRETSGSQPRCVRVGGCFLVGSKDCTHTDAITPVLLTCSLDQMKEIIDPDESAVYH